jgi:group I intron endonuclease
MSTKKRAAKKVTIDYKNGQIYKVVNDVNDMLYIGSTCTTLSRRFSSHKQMSKTATSRHYAAMRELGVDRFRIILIEKFPCTCKAELVAREYEVMKTFSQDKLYNSVIDGTPDQDARDKMKANSALKGKVGADHPNFKRGSICFYKTTKQECFQFGWQQEGKQTAKTFTIGQKHTREMAYLACVEMREKIYPLTNQQYLAELPFAE